MASLKFKNQYSEIKKKEEYFTIQKDKTEMTDQSQLASASIREMAKKFGIDALISKAKQMTIENQKVLDTLYGHDYSNMFKSKEELLNTKRNLNAVFEKLPAEMRKTVFKDNVMEFVNAYTYNDEKKLTELHKYGLVSDTQLNAVKNYNKNIQMKEQENRTKARFITELEKSQGALYENFKKTGTININDMQNNTTGSKDVQTDLG